MKFLNPLSANVEYNPHGDTPLVAVVAPRTGKNHKKSPRVFERGENILEI